MNRIMKFLERLGKIVLPLGVIFGSFAGTKGYAQQAQRLSNETLVIDNFQEDVAGGLPVGWYDRNGDHKVSQLDAKEQARYYYKVMENNGNKFLRYEGTEAMHLNFPLT